MIRLVIFDLDGTILDTSPGIVESVQYASEKLGYPELTERQLLSFVGPPLRGSFKRCYGCSDAEAESLTTAFRDSFRRGAVLNAVPYEGMTELLEGLHKNGTSIGIASGKPQVFAEQILKHFCFDQYIDFLHGSDLEGRLSKTDVIRMCIEDSGADPTECIMIGDTEHDQIGAKEAGVGFIAVTYGFGFKNAKDVEECIGVSDTPMGVAELLRNKGEIFT